MFIAALSSELSEKMAIGGKLTLMGILIVFGLLALIVIVLTIMERIMRKSGEKPKKESRTLASSIGSSRSFPIYMSFLLSSKSVINYLLTPLLLP